MCALRILKHKKYRALALSDSAHVKVNTLISEMTSNEDFLLNTSGEHSLSMILVLKE
jgi:hypothetical protein